ANSETLVEKPVGSMDAANERGVLRLGHAPSLRMTLATGLWVLAAAAGVAPYNAVSSTDTVLRIEEPASEVENVPICGMADATPPASIPTDISSHCPRGRLAGQPDGVV